MLLQLGKENKETVCLHVSRRVGAHIYFKYNVPEQIVLNINTASGNGLFPANETDQYRIVVKTLNCTPHLWIYFDDDRNDFGIDC